MGWRGRLTRGAQILEEEKKKIEQEADNKLTSNYTWDQRKAWLVAVYRDIANYLFPRSVKMKEGIPGAHNNKRLPILDTEVQINNDKVIYFLYLKPMASIEVINSRFSISMGSNLDIMTQEANRRLRNCSFSLPWSDNLGYIHNIMVQIIYANYPESSREFVLTRVFVKIDNDLYNNYHLGQPIYRSKQERNLTTKKNKDNWFRHSGATTRSLCLQHKALA